MAGMIDVGAILSFAVQKLGDYLIHLAQFLQAVDENAEWLKKELEYMQSFVEDAEQNQDGDHRVKQWISDVKLIAEDTVHLVDSVNDDGASSRIGLKRKRELTRYSIAKEIESLKARVLELSNRRVRYGINNISGERNKIRPLRRVPSYIEDEVVVGLEDEAERIIGQLLREEPRRCIVSVYGMGGLGKTTLARMVYNSATVDAKFVCRAWVCVTQEWSIEDLLRSILRSFQKGFMSDEAEMVGKMGVADLERYLRQYLELRKYLVVVDDLWHREAWESLKRALPDCQNGSRVIITTRKEEIAARADRRSFPHKLRFRTPEESWNLFCNKASPAGAWSPAMANLGREMVGKCSGLPLAITVLGGLLSYQRGLEKWQEVRAHIWDRLKEDSVEIHELLSLSYHDLSPNLKSCFLYLGIFPKDHVFNAEKLILLWMAEELIPPPLGGKRMEDVAEDYLEELINRSLVLPAQRFWGKIVGCRLHNLLRDLTVNKAKEVKLFQIYDREINFKQSRPGRLIIQDHVKENFPRVFDSNTQLRSLVFTKANPRHRVKPESIELVCEKFKLLRVLDFEGVNLSTKDVPDQMRKLSRLKFLGLTETSLTRLPPAIGNLRMLQTLEAMGELTGIRLPKEVSKMKKLRHIRAHIDGPLHPLETMENLQTLRYVRYDQWVNFDPSKLTSLQELEIRSIARSSKISSAYSIQSISKLQNLRSLMLSSSLTDDLPPLEPLSSCPRLVRLWLHGKIERLRGLPESITTLTLMGSQLSEDPMPILEKLPNLTSLELKNAHNHERMVCASDGFRQLEFLELAGLRRLQEWIVKDGAMPQIKGLVIFDCNRLERLPAKLKSVSIRQVPEQNYLVSDYRYETSWAYDWEKPENIP